jgi:hypothetical protein
MPLKIFIHIPKNGGMTIRRNPKLRSKVILCTPNTHISAEYTQNVTKTMAKYGEHHGYEHARWRDLDVNLRKNHKAFAIVRNPWSRVVSRYMFAKKVIEIEEDSNRYQEYDYADISSFEAFLEERHKWGQTEYFWHRAIRGWYPAFDHVSDEEGKVRCDILRFEHYNEDIKAYLGVLENPPPRNVTGLLTGSYQELYTPKTIQIVADWYKKDIDYWGFDFDTSATRNYWR